VVFEFPLGILAAPHVCFLSGTSTVFFCRLKLSWCPFTFYGYMATDFLIPLAQQLKEGKNLACRRAIARILSLVTVKFEAGMYDNQSQAERDFRRLAEAACARASSGEIE
jgi:hypothetical protein